MQTVYVKRLSHEDISSQTAAVFGLVAAVYSKDVSKALFRPAILPRLPRSSIPISISTLEISHQTVWQVGREISPAVFHDCIHGRCIVKNGDTRLQALHKLEDLWKVLAKPQFTRRDWFRTAHRARRAPGRGCVLADSCVARRDRSRVTCMRWRLYVRTSSSAHGNWLALGYPLYTSRTSPSRATISYNTGFTKNGELTAECSYRRRLVVQYVEHRV